MNNQEPKKLVNPFAPMSQDKYFGILRGWDKLRNTVSRRRGKRKYFMK